MEWRTIRAKYACPTGSFATRAWQADLFGCRSAAGSSWCSRSINTAGVRRIYLDRPHPKNPIPSWNGHSVGRWEGDTLIVDTVGFNDKSWLFGGMEPHTEEAHLMERIRRPGNGAFMEIAITVEDREALTSAYTYSRYYKKQPDTAEMAESVCNEDPETWKAVSGPGAEETIGPGAGR